MAESDDLIRCGGLADTSRLAMILIAGNDVVDASRVRSFAIEAGSGSGDADLTGGALGDDLYSDNGSDTAARRAGGRSPRGGQDNVRSAPDEDTVDGGPGADEILTGAQSDVVLARDGERDEVECGSGTDVVIADRADVLRD